jgi:hypothetical protein
MSISSAPSATAAFTSAAERLARVPHHRGIDAHGRDLRHRRILVRPQRLAAQRGDFAGRVLALERREIDHRDGEFQALHLGGFLDRARGVFRNALLDTHAVHGADFVEQPRECGRGWFGQHGSDYRHALL